MVRGNNPVYQADASMGAENIHNVLVVQNSGSFLASHLLALWRQVFEHARHDPLHNPLPPCPVFFPFVFPFIFRGTKERPKGLACMPYPIKMGVTVVCPGLEPYHALAHLPPSCSVRFFSVCDIILLLF